MMTNLRSSSVARLRFLLVILVMMFATTEMWGAKVTFLPNELTAVTNNDYSHTKENITIAVTTSTVTVEEFRIFKNQTLTISTTNDNTITGVEITCTKENTTKYGPGCFGDYDGYSYASYIGTWSGSANSISLKASGNQVRATSIVVTYSSGGGDEPEPEPDPVDPEVTFSNGEYTVGGAALDLSTLLTTNSTGAVTYSVTDAGTTGATIEGSTFTATAAGTCTVQASQAATTSYNAITKTATITVTAPAGGGGSDDCDNPTWQLVTNVSDLAVGDEIVIAASNANYALSTTQNNNNRSATAITKSYNTITFNEAVQIITLAQGSKTGTLSFAVGSAGFLYAASSTANHLKSKTISDNNCDWVISITDGVATIQARGTNTHNIMRYNPNNGSPIFACYASTSTTGSLPAIYKKVCTAETAVSSYTVNHYKQNLDGTYPQEPTATESDEKNVDSQYTPQPEEWVGFELDGTKKTIIIDADPKKNIVNYYYVRQSYTLTWDVNGGTITEAGTSAGKVKYETQLTAPTVTKSGYRFTSWHDGTTNVTFPKTMPASDKTFTAQWTKVYTITLSSVQNGTISTNKTTAAAGEIVTLTATPHDGYRFGSWIVKDANGNTIAMEVSNSNTFKMPESNVTVSATFNKPILSFVTQPDDPIKFDAVNCGSNTPKADAKQVEVMGENLVGNVSVEVTGPYKIAKTDADIKDYTTTLELESTQDGAINANYDVIRIISCPPAGKSDPTTGTLTFTTKNGNILTVNLYTPTVNCAEYTIKWMVNGVVHASQTALRGTEINVPENPSDGICDGKKFVGWTTTRINEPQDEAPAFISEFGTITSDQTYYAVFATEAGGGGEVTTIWNETFGDAGAENIAWSDSYTGFTGKAGLTYSVENSPTTIKISKNTQGKTNSAIYTATNTTCVGTFTVSGLNTLGYTDLSLVYHVKLTGGSSQVKKVTINGIDYEHDNSLLSNSYAEITCNNIPSQENLSITFSFGSNGGANYLDDITLIGKRTSTTYSGYITNCTQVPDPTWVDAQITHTAIKANCGSTTVLGAAGENGPATISFGGTDLQSSVTVTASDGFLVSTDKTTANKYTTEVTVNPHKDGQNIGTIQNVYVIANAPAQSGNYTGTITLTGNDITNGSQVINVTAAVTCTQYTITWSVSGDTEMIEPTTFYAGGDWELPENPTFECNSREFVGWTNTEILQPQDIAPNVLYKEQSDFPTIESNTTFYAVFAKGGTDDGSGTATVTDILNRDLTGITETKYSNWFGKTATSSAVYAGNSAGGNSSIQLRTEDSNSGIVTTTSGGKAKEVTVVWNSNTSSGCTLNIYGKNSAYSAATDLYGDNAGTLIGSITYNTSTTITIDGDYEYIGIRSSNKPMYLTSIAITWETEGEGDGNATTYTSYTTSCADVKAIRIVEPTTETFNEGDKFVFDGKVLAINSDDSETDVTNSPYVRYDVDMYKVGTQTVTVSYLGFTASYEITINAVDKWQITWNVSGATNTGLSPVTVEKGTAIGTPPTPKAIPSGCTGKSFIGWTESNVVNADGSDITYLQPSDIPTKHTTYYAVFATPSGDDNVGNIFNESFHTNEGIGGNDETWNDIKTSTAVSIDGWSFTKGYVAYKCIRLGTGDVAGSATTPALGINGSATLTFNAGAWDGNDEKLNIILNIIGEGDIKPSTFTLTKGQFNTYTANITGANADTKVQFIAATASKNRFFLDEVRVSEVSGNTTYTDYTTGCHDVTITYYGFTGGYTTNCGGSDLNVITQRVNSSHTIPYCTEITDPTTLGRTFLGTWKDQNGKERKPGDNFIVTENITFYAQWALNTSGNTTLPTDVEDLANTDIVVTGGNTLTLGAGTTTIKSLTLKGGIQADGSYKMPIIYVPDNATLKRKSDIIYLDLVVNAKNYYPFAVPFRAKNGSAKADWDYVGYIDPVLKEAATYRTHFVIKTYDGAKRAENGENRDANWVIVNRDTYLEPGVGYMITAMTYAGKDTVTMRIPMRVSDDWFAGGEKTTINDVTRNTIAVTAHTGAAATEHQRHAGWNFVASPYLSQFAGNNVENNGAFINGEILIQPGFDYGGEDVPYVTIPAYDFSYYEQVKLSEAMLSPEWSFFVQVGTGGTMNFTTAGRQQAPAHLAARAAEQPIKMDVDITLSDDNHSDQTGLIICDRFSDAYEIGHDLEKMFGSAYNLSVYTLMADNTPLAFQALAIQNSMQVIPVGYRTPAQGEYTFALNEATSDIELLNEQYEQLILVDYETGALTNMLNNEYTFYSDRTQSNNRFALYAVPRQNTTTDLPNTIGNEEVKKVIYNDHFYILRDGKVFNGAGQIVK